MRLLVIVAVSAVVAIAGESSICLRYFPRARDYRSDFMKPLRFSSLSEYLYRSQQSRFDTRENFSQDNREHFSEKQ